MRIAFADVFVRKRYDQNQRKHHDRAESHRKIIDGEHAVEIALRVIPIQEIHAENNGQKKNYRRQNDLVRLQEAEEKVYDAENW